MLFVLLQYIYTHNIIDDIHLYTSFYFSPWSQVHGCTLQDTVVSFTCTRDNKLFALRDTGDVMVTQLSPPLQSVPTEPLPMHPMSEDNYGTDEATALLLLETTPLTLIIAHSSGNGTIYHCVYMESDKVYNDKCHQDTLPARCPE